MRLYIMMSYFSMILIIINMDKYETNMYNTHIHLPMIFNLLIIAILSKIHSLTFDLLQNHYRTICEVYKT